MTRSRRSIVFAAACLAIGVSAARGDGLTRASLLEEAWKLAQQVPSLDQRAVLMADVAAAHQGVNPGLAGDYLAEAGFVATTVPTELGRALALQAVARRIAPIDAKWAADLFDEAVALANRMAEETDDRKPVPAQAGMVLIEVARGRAESDPEVAADLLDRATIQARAIPDVEVVYRIAALRDVSEAYGEMGSEQAQVLFDEALAEAAALEDPVKRDLSLADLAGFIAKQSLQQAIAVAGSIVDPAARSQALRDVALRIPGPDAALALELVQSIPDAPAKVSTLTDIALGGAPADVAAVAAERAEAIAEGMEQDDTGLEARVSAAAAWAATNVDKALSAAKEIGDEYFAANARGRIATYLAPVDPAKAEQVLTTIERGVVRVAPLRALVDVVAKEDPQKAYELAGEIRSRRFRVEAFLTIAANLPEIAAEEG